MTKREARKVIQQLVDAINDDNNKYGLDLWNIVSALRGPDNENSALKSNTTAEIRGAIGLVDNNFEVCKFVRRQQLNRKEVPYHFSSHYHNAVTALKRLSFITEKASEYENTDSV